MLDEFLMSENVNSIKFEFSNIILIETNKPLEANKIFQMLEELLMEEYQQYEAMMNDEDLALFEKTLVDETLICPICT
jgi:hypothetical protein